MLTTAAKLHKITFQQQGYLGLKLNISQVLPPWNRFRNMNGDPSLFPFQFFASSGQALWSSR